MPRYLPNSPMSRLQYVVKTYRNQPEVMLSTWRVAFNMMGIYELDLSDNRHLFAYHEVVGKTQVDYDKLLIKHAKRLAQPFRYDFLFPWLARELAHARKRIAARMLPWVAYDNLEYEIVGRGTAIAQWAEANRVDLMKTDLETALQKSRDWAAPTIKIVPAEVVYAFPDGWTVQLLTTSAQLESEGDVMQQCVGEYCERVQEGKSVIYSLRDARGNPHVTMEFNPHTHRFTQIYGKQNQNPKEEYAARVRTFIRDQFNAEPRSMIMAGADPRTLNLRGANLNGVQLAMLDLSGVDLSGASLVGAKLFNSNLEEADLRQADLRRAVLNQANLRYADLRGADLRGADLDYAYLRGAKTEGVIDDDDTMWPSESYFSH